MVIGSAGIEAVGTKYKVRHRAEFGISILKEFWGLGAGRALLAVSMYKKAGFVEYGRDPKGFYSRKSGFQEILYMRLEL